MQIEQKELSVYKGQISKLENQANELTITNQEENVFATELKAKLKEIGKTIKTRKEEITKPLNEALRSARELFSPLESQFDNAETIVGNKLLAYKKKVDAEIRAKEEKIARDAEAGKIKIETAEKKMEKLEEKKLDTHIDTAHGRVQFRKVKRMRIIKRDLIPDQYWVIDEVLLRKDVLAGVVVPGAEMYEEETV